MAQPDLYAQKLLMTSPEEGFGDATVLPYRRHDFDYSGISELRRERTRQELAKQARLADNEDFLNQQVGKLNEYDRAFHDHMDAQRKNVINTAVSKARQGVNLKTDPDFIDALTKYQQDANATKQIVEDKNKILQLGQNDVGKYINLPSYKGAALKNLDEAAMEVNNGNRAALQKNIAPNLLDPEHFKFDEFIHDKAQDVGKYANSNDSIINGGLGQFIKHTEKGYRFYTKDANGHTVPGVDKSVTDYFLNTPTTDQDMLQFRQVIDNLADKHIENKALLLKKNNPDYENLGLTRIKELISSDPKNANYINKDAYKEGILKQKLAPEQSITEKQGLRTSHKYPTGSGASGENLNIVKTYDQSRNTSAETNGVSKIRSGWVPEEWRLEGKKMDSPLLVNTTKIYDEKTNHELSPESTTGDKTFKPTRMMLVPYNKKNDKYVHGDKDKVLNQGDIGYKWVVGGILVNGKTEKAVTIPYEEIKPDLNAKYGIDLDERDVSEVSNYELIDQINSQYPDSTPEERAAIFKKLRGE